MSYNLLIPKVLEHFVHMCLRFEIAVLAAGSWLTIPIIVAPSLDLRW